MLSVMVVAVESEISEVAATEMELVPKTTGVSKAVEVFHAVLTQAHEVS